MLQVITQHFEDIDRLCELLESLIDRVKTLEERVEFLESQHPRKKSDWGYDDSDNLIPA